MSNVHGGRHVIQVLSLMALSQASLRPAVAFNGVAPALVNSIHPVDSSRSIRSTVPAQSCGCSRRVVCAALATTAAARRPTTASAADPVMIAVQKIEAGLAVLDDVVARWAELTTDCNYGEIRRELLESANKEALLKAATQTSKSGTMVTMCKATGRLVREAIGKVQGIDKVLETPALVARVAEDEFDTFLGESERLQNSLSGADAAARAGSSDFSAQTTFKRGERPSTPNLDAARDQILDARDALEKVYQLVRRNGNA